jgi:hypothetical protein
MTLHPETHATRLANQPRGTDDGCGRPLRPSYESENHPGDKGVRIVSLALLGMTVVGAIAMIGFNWTTG